MSIKLGIIREGKVPVDRRVPFTPAQAREIMNRFPHVTVVIQQSRIRCFKDEEYKNQGIEVVDDLVDCDIIMGIKEVPVSTLISKKTYLFFSHTIKEQPYNKKLLQAILRKKIRLVDYEVLRDIDGNRLVAFGRYAGIVGTYNGLWAYGKRYHLYKIKRAFNCFDLDDLKNEFKKIKLPAVKIVLTGGGRVGSGACEVLNEVGIKKVSPDAFLRDQYNYPVFTQLNSSDYHQHVDHAAFERTEFHKHPEKFKSTFNKYAQVSDILIAGAYWNPKAPKLFTRMEMNDPQFKIKVIADISCDINGSIPATVQPTNVNDPIFDFDPVTESVQAPLSDERNITVMAIDNLPCELPRSASHDFGQALIDRILPALLLDDKEDIIKRATIAEAGELTEEFQYLKTYSQ